MENKYFKQYKIAVEHSKPGDMLFNRAYLLLDLTERQNNIIYDLLEQKNFPKDKTGAIILKDGITIKRSEKKR